MITGISQVSTGKKRQGMNLSVNFLNNSYNTQNKRQSSISSPRLKPLQKDTFSPTFKGNFALKLESIGAEALEDLAKGGSNEKLKSLISLCEGDLNPVVYKFDNDSHTFAHRLARWGNVEGLEALIKKDPKIVHAKTDNYQDSLMHEAANHDHVPVVKLLEEHGLSLYSHHNKVIDRRYSSLGLTPFDFAMSNGSTAVILHAIKSTKENKDQFTLHCFSKAMRERSSNSKTLPPGSLRSAIAISGQLPKDADVSEHLVSALNSGSTILLDSVLKHGGQKALDNPTKFNHGEVFDSIAMDNNEAVAELLFKHSSIIPRYPYAFVKTDSMREIVYKQIKKVDSDNVQKHLEQALFNGGGGVANVKFLHSKGVNFLAKDSDGTTVLNRYTGNSPDLDAVKYLVEKTALGAKLNDISSTRTPYLLEAVHAGNIQIMEYLESKGANPHIMDGKGNNAFHYVTGGSRFDDTTQARYRHLTSKGININQANHNGDTPLHVAAAEEGVEKVIMLLEYGANKYIRNRAGKTAHTVFKESKGSDISAYFAQVRDSLA